MFAVKDKWRRTGAVRKAAALGAAAIAGRFVFSGTVMEPAIPEEERFCETKP
jgi:hypothetical protein